MTWKLYVVVSAGAFAATYLLSSPKTEPDRPAPAAARSASRSKAETEIEALADSLHIRPRIDAGYQTPGRDPFSFQSSASRQPAFVPPPARPVENLPAPAPVLPTVSLSGIASDVVDGTIKRSAVLSAPGGVLIVREGESVGGLYTVISIGEESVELEAADGSRRTLRFSGR